MDRDAIILSIIFLMCAIIGFAYLLYDSHVRYNRKARVINNDRPRHIEKRN